MLAEAVKQMDFDCKDWRFHLSGIHVLDSYVSLVIVCVCVHKKAWVFFGIRVLE